MSMLVLFSALPMLAAGFLLDIFIHRQESFAAIVAARGLIYVVLGSGQRFCTGNGRSDSIASIAASSATAMMRSTYFSRWCSM